MSEFYFDHEKLIVYQKSLEFAEWANELIRKVKVKVSAIDNLDRASTSVTLNIAEGNGKYTSKDRCRFFDISRGSALECSACLDILVAKKLLRKEDILEGKKVLKEVVSMLVGLIKSNSNRVYENNELYNS